MSAAFPSLGVVEAAVQGRWLLFGALALYAYGAACVAGARAPKVPPWLAAAAAWAAWFSAASAIWFAGRAAGVMH
jgi:hypothetical protein